MLIRALLTARHNSNDLFTFIAGTACLWADDSALGCSPPQTKRLDTFIALSWRYGTLLPFFRRLAGQTLDCSSTGLLWYRAFCVRHRVASRVCKIL